MIRKVLPGHELEEPFRSWLDELASIPLLLLGEKNEIARENLWSFTLSDEERSRTEIGVVVSFVEGIFDSWESMVGLHGSVVLYAWYDEMARSLRVSAMPGTVEHGLPFGCQIELVSDVQSIAMTFLDTSWIILICTGPWTL